MTKKQIHTIILQEEEIKKLKKRNKELLAGYIQIHEINKQLREENDKLRRRECELSGVNT